MRQMQPRVIAPARVASQKRRPIASWASAGWGQAPQTTVGVGIGSVGRGTAATA